MGLYNLCVAHILNVLMETAVDVRPRLPMDAPADVLLESSATSPSNSPNSSRSSSSSRKSGHMRNHAAARQSAARAARFANDHQVTQALRWYGDALEGFQRAAAETDDESGWILLCHAANCLLKMGELHYHQQLQLQQQQQELPHEQPTATNVHAATLCWEQADVLYRNCRQFLLLAAARAKEKEESQEEGVQEKKNTSDSSGRGTTGMDAAALPANLLHSASALRPDQECLCLDALIVETLQKRAAAQSQHPSVALECHEDVVEFLMDLNKTQQKPWDTKTHDPLHVVDSVVFRPITKEQHTQLLTLSLEKLGSLYRSTRSQEGRLTAIGDALDLIRQRRRESPDNVTLSHALLRILRNLSQVYLELEDLDQAFAFLNESFDIQLSGDEEPPEQALDAMDKMGALYEESENYDGAMSCYERTLLVRSRFWGNKHPAVAKSLINVARVMELQGNIEGSLDLYKAAKSIYADQLNSRSFDVETDDAVTLLNDLFPVAMQQGRYEDAIAYLSKCVEVAEDETRQDSITLDKTVIYYRLGEAYIGLRDYVSATVCLVEAAKHDGEIHEEQVFALLQHVEFLQRGEHKSEQDGILRKSASLSLPHSSERRLVGESRTISSDGPSANPLLIDKAKKDADVTYESDIDDDGTAFYDSESVSASIRSGGGPADNPESEDLSHSLLESDLDTDVIEIDISPQEETYDDKSGPIPISIPIPAVKEPPVLARTTLNSMLGRAASVPGKGAPSSVRSQPGIGGNSVHSNSRTLRVSLGSPRRRKDEESVQSSQRSSSIARSFSSRFLRRSQSVDKLENREEPREEEPPIFPSEEEYHTKIDGPICYISVPAQSWDSDVSEITMRFDDPNSPKERLHEWWWGVTAEGFGRWFPSTYVSKAVELADGFLSARAIHENNKKKQAQEPLEYISDEDSIENSDSILRDHPSHVGVADAKTRGFLSATDADYARSSPAMATNLQHGALNIYPGRHQRQQGKDAEAEIRHYTELVKHQKTSLGKDHAEVATSLFTLAVLYSRNQAPAPAIEAATEALRIQKLHAENEDAARSLHFLADLCLHQKDYSSALTYYTESLRLEKQVNGVSSDEVAKTLNCIGTVYSLQNEFSRAMNSHQEALRILKECHGDELKHPLVSETLCQIGAVYYRERNSLSKVKTHTDEEYTTFIEAGMLEAIGRAHEDRGSYKLAISFFEERLQFLESRKPVGEDELEEVATTLNSLGMLSSRAGFLVEAIDYYEKALKIMLQLGCDRVQVATARILTGSVHFQLGDWTKALRLHHEALAVLQDELGLDHETVAAAWFQIGIVHAARCEYETARSYYVKAFRAQNISLSKDHPATLRTRREIANIDSLHAGKLDSVLEELNMILESQRQLHGDRHPNIAETLFSIGHTYALKDDYASALQILEECYYMRTEFLGWDHPAQATTLHEICRIHLKRGRVKRALHIVDVVLGIRKEALTEEHIDVALALATKASCLGAQQQRDEATKTFKEALSMAENAVGRSHVIVADIHLLIAEMHWQNCRFQESRLSIEVALRAYRNARLADDHPSIKEALGKLERVKRSELLYV